MSNDLTVAQPIGQNNAEPVVNLKDLRFSYGDKPLFSSLQLEIQRGNIHGLLGKNGAGKTTLLKLLSGQLFPENGTVTVLGEEPRKSTPLDTQSRLPKFTGMPTIFMSHFLPFPSYMSIV